MNQQENAEWQWYKQLTPTERQELEEVAEIVAANAPLPLSLFGLFAKLKHGYVYRMEDATLSMEGDTFLLTLGENTHPFRIKHPRETLELVVMTLLQGIGSFEAPKEPRPGIIESWQQP